MLLTKLNKDQRSTVLSNIHDCNINLETREIFLHGHISSHEEGDPGVEWRMSNIFLKNLRLLECLGDDPIIVHQHSVGGDWDAGMMIYDAISNCSAHVLFVMWGCACSMGSIIPQSADKRVIAANCNVLIHDGSTGIDSSFTHAQSQSWAKYEETIRKKMVAIYLGVCRVAEYFSGWTDNKIEKFLVDHMNKKGDWWLNSQDAVKYGFADGILGDIGFETLGEILDQWLK